MAISLVTVKMGLVIPISHGNLRSSNYHGKYRGNFTEKSPNNIGEKPPIVLLYTDIINHHAGTPRNQNREHLSSCRL